MALKFDENVLKNAIGEDAFKLIKKVEPLLDIIGDAEIMSIESVSTKKRPITVKRKAGRCYVSKYIQPLNLPGGIREELLGHRVVVVVL